MDPFVTIEYNGVKYKTCVIQNGGKKPIWNDQFELDVISMTDELKFCCLDEDVWSNDVVGEAHINVSYLC